VLQVTNSPFTQEQADLLNRLLPTLSDTQRIWLNGYLSAAAVTISMANSTSTASISALPAALETVQATPAAPKEVTVLIGSQTGNSSGLGKKLKKQLEEQGCQVTLSSMNDFKSNTLKKLTHLLIIVSTHGEGEPPDSAISFYEFLHSKRAPQLDGLKYSVLALGDTSYEFFCQTGKDFDKRLSELGATPLAGRIDCDVDYDEAAGEWMKEVAQALSEAASSAAQATDASAAVTESVIESAYSRTHPFQAEVLENLNLNGRGSDRETRHLEFSLEGSNLQYEPGDSLGIYPENHPQLVDDIITAMNWSADEQVTVNKNGDKATLREALTRYFEITVLTKSLVEGAAKLSSNESLLRLAADDRRQELKAYTNGKDLLDLIQDYALQGIAASDFVGLLRKLPARLYSISSSPSAYPEEVHVTVRSVRYESAGRERYGVCSVQLAERVQAGDNLPVYIQHNENFKLPTNLDVPIIMIGPGTGVAPFRAFLGEREELGADGNTWLFYGDQHFVTDFLYQVEWQRWLESGVLTRMDVAFSRDTDEKIYVQHRMLENSKDLYEWLQQGAYVYVCGDEKRMAHDVHAALLSILQQEGGLSEDAAAQYLSDMQQQKRYQRDVY